MVVRPLRDFDDPQRYPNIALIALPVAQAEILARLAAFRRSRSTLDALEHIVRWLAFAWGAARTPNPLHDNYGLPSACMLETVCAAANFDLTPGLEARASCPEAIWVAARFWQDYFEQFHKRAIVGRYWTAHRYPIWEPGDDPRTASPKSRRGPPRGGNPVCPRIGLPPTGSPMSAVEPFRIAVPDATLTDLRERLSRTRWPEDFANDDWQYGTNAAYLKSSRVLAHGTTGARRSAR